MQSTKMKVAIATFLFFFGIWIVLICSVYFPTWLTGPFRFPLANSIKFANFTVMIIFLGSAVASSVTCMVIGLSYLGLRIAPRKKAPSVEKPQPQPIVLLWQARQKKKATPQITHEKMAVCINVSKDQDPYETTVLVAQEEPEALLQEDHDE